MDQRYWDMVIERYKSSGQLQEAFCKSENVPLNKFKYYWQKYRKKAHKELSANRVYEPFNFEPVSVTESPSTEPPSKSLNNYELSLTFASGLNCQLSFNGSVFELAAFLKELNNDVA